MPAAHGLGPVEEALLSRYRFLLTDAESMLLVVELEEGRLVPADKLLRRRVCRAADTAE
jgi:hypothetical protein